jgi:hypothetical protein
MERHTKLELDGLDLLLSRLDLSRLFTQLLLLVHDIGLDVSNDYMPKGRNLTLISLSFESLLFLKSSISFSRRLQSAWAAFCFSLAALIVSFASASVFLAASTSAMICSSAIVTSNKSAKIPWWHYYPRPALPRA